MTILMLIMCSKRFDIFWQALYGIDNKVKNNYWKHDDTFIIPDPLLQLVLVVAMPEPHAPTAADADMP